MNRKPDSQTSTRGRYRSPVSRRAMLRGTSLAALGGSSRGAHDPIPIPTMAIEAEETDCAVIALPSELRRTVEVVYLGRGGAADHARVLVVPVPTVRSRVCQAHKAISNWLADKAQGRENQRENDARLQSVVLRNITNR